MVATLLRLVGIDLKCLARKTAITIVLAILGAFAAMLALALCFAALYLWLDLQLGTTGFNVGHVKGKSPRPMSFVAIAE